MPRVATWNVNSLRVRLPQVLDWLQAHQPDLLALQETKLPDPEFPLAAFVEAGYHAVSTGQKTYNGVAILSREPLAVLATDLPDYPDPQRRVLLAECTGLRVLNLYVPNGQEVGSDKYAYKLDWLKALATWIKNLLRGGGDLLVLGDFNIAPEDRDVHDPEVWRDQVLFSEPEKAAFRVLLELGLVDCFRLFQQDAAHFTWWDYRAGAFRRNHGLRIDHILASRDLAARCRDCRIDKMPRSHERPSDHTPVLAEFEPAR